MKSIYCGAIKREYYIWRVIAKLNGNVVSFAKARGMIKPKGDDANV